MVETAVFAQWIPRGVENIHYANWKQNNRQQGEVDIVGLNMAKQKPEWTVEVKWTDRYYEKPGELNSLLYFMAKHQLKSSLVTTISCSGLKQLDTVSLQFIPVACYAYTVGYNTLEQVKQSRGL